MKIWLDDIRKPPQGYKWFKEVKSLKKFFKKNYRKITQMSLDHDLGENVPTGYDFIAWIEMLVHVEGIRFNIDFNVHSANPVGEYRMLQAIKSINRKLGK